MVTTGSDDNRFDDKDPNVENMLDQLSIDGIPEGEHSAIKDGSSNINKEMIGTHHSK